MVWSMMNWYDVNNLVGTCAAMMDWHGVVSDSWHDDVWNVDWE